MIKKLIEWYKVYKFDQSVRAEQIRRIERDYNPFEKRSLQPPKWVQEGKKHGKEIS